MKKIEGVDAQSVIKLIIEDAEKDPTFYYRVKLNEDGKNALFWCVQ